MTIKEQRVILRATSGRLGDHTIHSLEIGTGFFPAEFVDLDIGVIHGPSGWPRIEVHLQKRIARGNRAARVTPPNGIPDANFWSFTLYESQTRSMLDTPKCYP